MTYEILAKIEAQLDCSFGADPLTSRHFDWNYSSEEQLHPRRTELYFTNGPWLVDEAKVMPK